MNWKYGVMRRNSSLTARRRIGAKVGAAESRSWERKMVVQETVL